MASIPLYRDLNVAFSSSKSSGKASVHYLEAGSPDQPTIILYHGFPSSSFQYRDLIPLLATDYHVLALDFPGFGLTTVPEEFGYTFENLAAVTSAWLEAMHLESYAIYIFDYGAPVGLRIALQQPEKVKAIITQNGNAYKEGFGEDFWKPIFLLWDSSNSEAVRQAITGALTPEYIQSQYVTGVPEADLALCNPVSWQLDYLANIAGEKKTKIQLDLFYDYRTNVELYPKFQEYFRTSKVPILAVWGQGDPAFIPPGAEAFKKDSPSTKVHLLDTGHFALETKRGEIARICKEWLSSIGY